MRSLFIALLVLVFFPSIVNAQTYGFDWANSTNITGSASAHVTAKETAVDLQGNYYVWGDYTQIVDFDPSSSVLLDTANSTDIFLQKFDPSGSLLWVRLIGGNSDQVASAIELDDLGNIYLTGFFNSTVDFDPGPGVFNMTTSNSDIFILKLNSSGNFIWAKKFSGSGFEESHDLKTDERGFLYVSGRFAATVDFDPGPATFNLTANANSNHFIVQLDSLGDFYWAKKLNSSTTNGDELIINIDSSSGIVASAPFRGTVDLNPGIGVFNVTASTSLDDLLIMRLDSSGNFDWGKKVGLSDFNDICENVITRSNEIVIIGHFRGTVDFDPNATVYNLTANSTFGNAFILKLNLQGSFIWAKQLIGDGSELFSSVIVDSNDNIYTSGITNAWSPPYVDFDPGPSIYNPKTDSVVVNNFLHKLNSAGNFQWVILSGSYTLGAGRYSDLVMDHHENFYLSASFRDSLDCNPGFGINNVINSSPFTTALANIKFTPCSGSTSATIFDTACYSYTSPSTLYTWTSSGTYLDTIPGSTNCDSIITINLTILGSTSATISPQTCNAAYTSPSTNYTWNTSGTYQDTIPNSQGCDSLLTIILTVSNNTFSTMSEYVCTSYTSPSTNYTWNTTGIYNDTLMNSQGCDSIITINLEVHDASAGISNDTLFANDPFRAYQWLDCDNNYALITGETNALFLPTASGNYAVEVSHNACIDTSVCIPFWAIGVDNIGKHNINIYPNPTEDKVHVQLDKVTDNFTVELLSLSGRLLMRQTAVKSKALSFDVSTISSGIYFIKIKTPNWSGVQKIEKL